MAAPFAEHLLSVAGTENNTRREIKLRRSSKVGVRVEVNEVNVM